PDGVVTGGQEKPVAVLPLRLVGTVSQLVGVDAGQHVGGAEGLPDISLALRFAHVERVVPCAVGGRRHLLAAAGFDGECHVRVPYAGSGTSAGLGSAAASSASWRSRGPQ